MGADMAALGGIVGGRVGRGPSRIAAKILHGRDCQSGADHGLAEILALDRDGRDRTAVSSVGRQRERGRSVADLTSGEILRGFAARPARALAPAELLALERIDPEQAEVDAHSVAVQGPCLGLEPGRSLVGIAKLPASAVRCATRDRGSRSAEEVESGAKDHLHLIAPGRHLDGAIGLERMPGSDDAGAAVLVEDLRGDASGVLAAAEQQPLGREDLD